MQVINCQKQKDKKIRRDKNEKKKKFVQKRNLEMKINETENQVRNGNMRGGKTNGKIKKGKQKEKDEQKESGKRRRK